MNKELQIYKLLIDGDDLGMEAISLVECPAVEVDFLTFNKEEHLYFNEEKHEIYGVVCLADTPIYRCNTSKGEHYIVFDKDIIKKMVLKYSKMNFNNNINIEHKGELVSGLTMIESFIKDSENGINPVQFKNVPDGSWICRFKVENPDIWEKIKSKEVKGFSLEGFFKYNEDENDWLDNLLNNNNMHSKILKLFRQLIKLASVETPEAVLYYDGELEVGVEVFIESPEGELVKPEDGTYGNITVADGKIAEIKEEEPVVEPTEEPVAQAEKAEPTVDEEKEALKAKVAELEAIIAEKDAIIAELEAKLAQIEEAKVEEEFNSLKPASKEIKDVVVSDKGALKYFQN